jgi:hypothetical protein
VRWLACVVALCAPAIAAADKDKPGAVKRVIRGVVVREGTPTPIGGASVLTERGAIAITDLDGYFTIDAGDSRELTIVATGYTTRTMRIVDGVARIEMQAASGAEVIEVTGKAPTETKPLSYQLTVDEIRSIPGAGNDILRAVTVLPGVARIPFSFGGLVLRGASPRDTAIYLDGVEVPIAFHFGGITSFYPSGMLSDLKVTSGGYDTSYGRAAGGVVTLATREPRTDRFRMGGSIGLFDSSVQAEGPWKGGGLLVGLRRSYLDRIVAPFVDDDVPLPSYYDFQIRSTFGDARKNYKINPMIFGSIDRVASDEFALTSLFVRVAAPVTVQRGPVTYKVVPWLGTNQLTFSDSSQEPKESFSRPFYPGGVRSEVVRDYKWGHLRGGAEISSGYLDQTRVNIEGDEELLGGSTLSWTDLALFGEWRFLLDGERFSIKPGLRIEGYGLSGEVVVDPRLNISQQLSPTVTVRQAIGRFHQPPTRRHRRGVRQSAARQLGHRSDRGRRRCAAAAASARVDHDVLQLRHRDRGQGAQSAAGIRGAGTEHRRPRTDDRAAAREAARVRDLSRGDRALAHVRRRGAAQAQRRAVVHAAVVHAREVGAHGRSARAGGLAPVRARPAPQPAARGIDPAPEVAARRARAGGVGQPVYRGDRQREPGDRQRRAVRQEVADVLLDRPARRPPMAPLLGRHRVLHRRPERDESPQRRGPRARLRRADGAAARIARP